MELDLRRRSAGLFLALLAAAQPLGSAPASAQTEVATVNGWMIRDEHGHCSAAKVQGGGVYVRLGYDFGPNSAVFLVGNPAWQSIRDGQIYSVSLDFSNGSEYPNTRATAVRVDDRHGRITGLRMDLDSDLFLPDFARAASLVMRMGEARLESLSLRGTSAMVQRLRACAAASFRRYPPPMVPAISPAPQSPPGGPSPPLHRSGTITNHDYPASAIRANEQGAVTVRLSIGADGRVVGCTVTESSGSSALDSATCSLAQRRFRFTPARDENGRNVAGSATRRVVWRLPEPPPPPLPPVPVN